MRAGSVDSTIRLWPALYVRTILVGDNWNYTGKGAQLYFDLCVIGSALFRGDLHYPLKGSDTVRNQIPLFNLIFVFELLRPPNY